MATNFEYAFNIQENLIVFLKEKYPKNKFEYSGCILRNSEVVKSIVIITNLDNYPDLDGFKYPLNENLEYYPDYLGHLYYKKSLIPTIPIEFYCCGNDENQFQWYKWEKSCSEDHFIQIAERIKLSYNNKSSYFYWDEDKIYGEAKLPFIMPEHREGFKEFTDYNTSNLITLQDIRGNVHLHTSYSDGKNTLREMAMYCKNNLNLEYMFVSDHSYSKHNPVMNEEGISKQFTEIELLNKELYPFKIFKSIEVDIKKDGTLVYDNETLNLFDFVIASIHSEYRMTKEEATQRVIKAIENPYVHMIGHLFNKDVMGGDTYQHEYFRYDLDMNKIIDSYADNNIVSELNCNPGRMDLHYKFINRLMNKGIQVSLNTDAHSCSQLERIRYGVNSARKGYLTKEHCFNAKNLKEMNQFIENKN